MNNSVLIAILLFLVTALFAALFALAVKKNYYHFRNIAYIAAGFGALFLGICYLLHGTGIFFIHVEAQVRLFSFVKAIALFMAILLTILCLIVSVSNAELIKHEGLKPRNVVGAGLELFFVGATAAVYLADLYVIQPLAADAHNALLIGRSVNLLLFIYAAICYFDMILVGIFVMGWLAAKQKPQYDKDFIIIPGCSIRKDGGLLPLLKGRTNRAIRYAWEQEIASGKPVLYVPSGGQGPDEIMSEGSAMEFYLLTHSAEQEEIRPEKQSRNTFENFYYSKKIIDAINPQAKVAFATTNYHVLRCGMLAHKAGMEVEGIASGTKWYFWPNGFAREVIAIYVLTKKYHILAVMLLLVACLFY